MGGNNKMIEIRYAAIDEVDKLYEYIKNLKLDNVLLKKLNTELTKKNKKINNTNIKY